MRNNTLCCVEARMCEKDTLRAHWAGEAKDSAWTPTLFFYRGTEQTTANSLDPFRSVPQSRKEWRHALIGRRDSCPLVVDQWSWNFPGFFLEQQHSFLPGMRAIGRVWVKKKSLPPRRTPAAKSQWLFRAKRRSCGCRWCARWDEPKWRMQPRTESRTLPRSDKEEKKREIKQNRAHNNIKKSGKHNKLPIQRAQQYKKKVDNTTNHTHCAHAQEAYFAWKCNPRSIFTSESKRLLYYRTSTFSAIIQACRQTTWKTQKPNTGHVYHYIGIF